jgi:hypothetical protein
MSGSRPAPTRRPSRRRPPDRLPPPPSPVRAAAAAATCGAAPTPRGARVARGAAAAARTDPHAHRAVGVLRSCRAVHVLCTRRVQEKQGSRPPCAQDTRRILMHVRHAGARRSSRALRARSRAGARLIARAAAGGCGGVTDGVQAAVCAQTPPPLLGPPRVGASVGPPHPTAPHPPPVLGPRRDTAARGVQAAKAVEQAQRAAFAALLEELAAAGRLSPKTQVGPALPRLPRRPWAAAWDGGGVGSEAPRGGGGVRRRGREEAETGAAESRCECGGASAWWCPPCTAMTIYCNHGGWGVP